jgi:hypothetical protein
MKFLLLSILLAGQPIYDTEKGCNSAATVINESYPETTAVCIPVPSVYFEQKDTDAAFNNFYDLIIKLRNLPPLEVDNLEER